MVKSETDEPKGATKPVRGEFRKLRISDLEVLEDNPNRMPDWMFAHLKRTIRRRGFQQPVTVTPKGEGKYTVIDGAHRVRALKECGRKTVPCWVIPDRGDAAVRIDLINLNRTRGKFNQAKYARMLSGMRDDYESGQLLKLIGMEEEEFDAYLELAMKWEAENGSPGPEDELDGVPVCPRCGEVVA